MKVRASWIEPPRPCSYASDHVSEIETVWVASLSPDEYMAFLAAGWRRFGHTLFRQRCSGTGACQSLRVDVAGFRPDRSQRRARKANAGLVRLRVGKPELSVEKVALFDRFHAERSDTRGWSLSEPGNTAEFGRMFVANPIPTQEWCYYLDDILIGIGYVDQLPRGLSAIYFARDPDYADHSLGTWNVLCILEHAAACGLPHVYLGYHTDACPSLRYKARFRPHQKLALDGIWNDGDA